MVAARDADVVVLAAGRSSRLGQPKGLVAVRGRPWLEHQLEALAGTGVGVRRVVLVLGFDREAYLAALPGVASMAVPVVNGAPERGPFSSLQCGLAEVVRDGDRPAFVLPVDVPVAAPDVWEALAGALGPGIDAVVPVHGKGGHPVLLSSTLVRHLLTLPPEGPESRLDLQLRLVSVARVPVADARVGLNLNVAEDWGKLEGGG
ncbi:MAG TPA: nucleotidyltransferase family protein [Polyangiaceae bacterium]|jgi:CTP:molybdopterin cytidylyltransferase MocA